MQRNQKIALASAGTSLSVLCITLSRTVRFAFPLTGVDFTRGFFIGLGIVAALVSTVSFVVLASATETQ
jgi:phosphatidylserine synthase